MAELARRHDGVVTARHLAAVGLSAAAVSRRVQGGRLHRLYPGVYAVGHTALSRRGRWLAAVWACGPRAVLSHRDAAALWGIRPSSRARIDVTTPDRGRKGHPDIDLHRVRRLAPEDVTVRDGVPVTTVARTLVDLAGLLDNDRLARAVHEAEVARLLDRNEVEAAIARARGRRGCVRLASLLATPAAPTRSELEVAFLRLVADAGLPRPQVNTLVDLGAQHVEVDFLWRAQRLVVETDGAASHLTRRAFERDRRRDLDLTLAGYRVVRVTWRQLADEPLRVAADLARLLRLAAPDLPRQTHAHIR